jgi:PAS domain S-box-containing protein
MADCAPVLIWRTGPDGRCDYFNRTWLEFTGRTMAQELGFGWTEGVHPEDRERCLAVYWRGFQDRAPFSMEYRLRRNDGHYRWIVDNGTPFEAETGEFAGFIGCGTDVHETLTSRDALARVLEAERRAARDKEELLGELQHRVRNTVQMIASMLSIQSRQAASEDAAALLTRSAARVRTMGQVQDRLFRRSTLGAVELGPYLTELAEQAFSSAQQGGLRLQCTTDGLETRTALAAPLGFIVSELVGNAVQHAFPRREAGIVTLGLTRVGADEAELVVADDGIGLPGGAWPPAMPPRDDRIGMTLLLALARQAKAAISVEREGGTRFRLRFPIA